MALTKLAILIAIFATCNAQQLFRPWHSMGMGFNPIKHMMIEIDRNGDGFISPNEVQVQFKRNVDTNRDGCVTLAEFQNNTKCDKDFATYMFNLLQQQYPVVVGSSCQGILVSSINPISTVGIVDFTTSTFITPMINYCEANQALYNKTDSVCRKLPILCRDSPAACTEVCKTYSFVTTKGRNLYQPRGFRGFRDFGETLQVNLKLNDFNNDSIVEDSESNFDLENNYDVNNDRCVDETEFMARQVLTVCGGVGSSDQYAQGRFNALAQNQPGCNGIRYPLAANSPTFTDTAFLDANIASTIQQCEADTSLDLYKTVTDCRTLPMTCRSDKYKALTSCKNYIDNTIAGRNSYPFVENSFGPWSIFEFYRF